LVEDEEMKDDHHSVTVHPRGSTTESKREMNVRLKSTAEMKGKGKWRRKESK
jgi:hypothetical protein